MNTDNKQSAGEKEKIGEPSPEAISHAKRMIALKWTKETNVDVIAGIWQAGYVFGQIDTNEKLRHLIDKAFVAGRGKLSWKQFKQDTNL